MRVSLRESPIVLRAGFCTPPSEQVWSGVELHHVGTNRRPASRLALDRWRSQGFRGNGVSLGLGGMASHTTGWFACSLLFRCSFGSSWWLSSFLLQLVGFGRASYDLWWVCLRFLSRLIVLRHCQKFSHRSFFVFFPKFVSVNYTLLEHKVRFKHKVRFIGNKNIVGLKFFCVFMAIFVFGLLLPLSPVTVTGWVIGNATIATIFFSFPFPFCDRLPLFVFGLELVMLLFRFPFPRILSLLPFVWLPPFFFLCLSSPLD